MRDCSSPDTLTVRLLPAAGSKSQHDQAATAPTVIMSSVTVAGPEARTVPVIQSLADNAPEREPGVHFLTSEDRSDGLVITRSDEAEEGVRTKSELLEYLIRNDGSVTCKLCGEILASRTHWYRHKYKLHVVATPAAAAANSAAVVQQLAACTASGGGGGGTSGAPSTTVSMNPAPLFKCVHCNVFFKSRKGYAGHVSARHADEDDTAEEAAAAMVAGNGVEDPGHAGGESARTSRKRDSGAGGAGQTAKGADWEQQREKEEKLVADIIDRVRRECEAQGAVVSRRGYSRRSTVMNTCN